MKIVKKGKQDKEIEKRIERETKKTKVYYTKKGKIEKIRKTQSTTKYYRNTDIYG